MKNKIYKLLKIFLILFLLLIISVTLINIYVLSFHKNFSDIKNSNLININLSKNIIYEDIKDLPYNKVGLVFGARVLSNGTPSDILKDRLDGAFLAYQSSKISKIIVSGDNRFSNYNEPENMRDYLVLKGINKSDIYLDYAGFDTYDSLYRAEYIFGINKLTLFTQEYHLKRAIYISDRLGIEAIGVKTDLREYRYIESYKRREILSRIKAFLDSDILKSSPKFLGKKIEIK